MLRIYYQVAIIRSWVGRPVLWTGDGDVIGLINLFSATFLASSACWFPFSLKSPVRFDIFSHFKCDGYPFCLLKFSLCHMVSVYASYLISFFDIECYFWFVWFFFHFSHLVKNTAVTIFWNFICVIAFIRVLGESFFL